VRRGEPAEEEAPHVAAVALSAAVLWRWVALPPAPPGTDTIHALHATPLARAASASPAAQEEFSAAERRRLDEILREKNMGAPR
jgi:hypothetical protein